MDNTIDFISKFKDNKTCIIGGSTWPDDEAVLLEFINNSPDSIKFIIAPHKIEPDLIQAFCKKLKKDWVLHSQKEGKSLEEFSVLIIDSIGLLSKIYSYADIAYVGGAMGATGLHNILEPITFGVPIVIGKNFKNFPEASSLLNLGGLYSIKNQTECTAILEKLTTDATFRKEVGEIAKNYAQSNIGATTKIMEYINLT